MIDPLLPQPLIPGVIKLNKSEIEKIIGVPFTDNNRVRVLKSGQETFQSILDAVASARKIICIEFYIFKDDSTGRKLAALLEEKAGQGVQVLLLYDHFGSFLTSSKFWLDLKKKGIRVRVSHPLKWSSLRGYIYRNHKKLLLIDGTKAVTGGFNIADEYHGYFKARKNIWRDTGIYLEGPIAYTLLGIFSRSWKTWKGESFDKPDTKPQFNGGVSVIPVFANSARARRRMRHLLLYSIRNSKKSIYLTTAYFIPSRKILRAIISSARRGVDLKLLLPGRSDVLSAYYAGRSYYRKLLMAGVEIYNYQGAVLHAKTSVFDRCWSIIGSTNLDLQSLRRNEESNVGIFDEIFSSQMIDIFQSDLQNSVKIDEKTWAKRPFYQKFLEKFFSLIMKRL